MNENAGNHEHYNPQTRYFIPPMTTVEKSLPIRNSFFILPGPQSCTPSATVLFVFLLIVVTVLPAAGSGKVQWERIEAQFGNKFYPQSLQDSIYPVFSVDKKDEAGLRVTASNPFSFKKQEICVYEGGWQFIYAGFGMVSATRDSGSNTVEIVGKLFTNNVMSAIYEVRDYSRTIMDAQGVYPLFFEHHIHENRYEKDSWILYKNSAGKLYTNGRGNTVEFTVTPFTHDYLSLVYYLRSLTFAPGDTFSIHCFVHGKDYPIFFQVQNRETITVKAGTFKCIKVIPHMVGDRNEPGFTKGDTMCLWLTDDNQHMVVQGTSKVRVGAIFIRLIHYERL